MNVQTHEDLKAKIWEIANRLRGPYRPPQYRLVMLPMVVLRRLDCVLEPTTDAVLKRHDELEKPAAIKMSATVSLTVAYQSCPVVSRAKATAQARSAIKTAPAVVAMTPCRHSSRPVPQSLWDRGRNLRNRRLWEAEGASL